MSYYLRYRRTYALFTARFPRAALAARCTSVSWLLRRKRMGSSVSRPTGRTSFSVISANARAALRCRSTLSENERVVNAESGSPVKKLVVVRSVCESVRLLREDEHSTHSLGTEADPRRPPSRSPRAAAHTTVTASKRLRATVSDLLGDCGQRRTARRAAARYLSHDGKKEEEVERSGGRQRQCRRWQCSNFAGWRQQGNY